MLMKRATAGSAGPLEQGKRQQARLRRQRQRESCSVRHRSRDAWPPGPGAAGEAWWWQRQSQSHGQEWWWQVTEVTGTACLPASRCCHRHRRSSRRQPSRPTGGEPLTRRPCASRPAVGRSSRRGTAPLPSSWTELHTPGTGRSRASSAPTATTPVLSELLETRVLSGPSSLIEVVFDVRPVEALSRSLCTRCSCCC